MADGENDWLDQLPPEYRTDVVTRFKTPTELAKAHVELNRFVSSTGRVPKLDSTNQDEWNSFYKHWGRPEKPEEYKTIDFPKGMELEDNFKGPLLKAFHEAGLNQKQANQLMTWGLQQSQGIMEQQQRANDTALGELKNEWGYKYESNRERANKTVAMLVDYKRDHPFVQWLESSGNVNNPTVIKFFNELSNRLGEDNFVDEQTKKEVSDQQSATKRINEIMADTKGPYFNPNDPRHKDTVEEMQRLYSVAYPET